MWTLLDTIVDCVRSRQGHPTKFFYKITVRKGEYCLEISKARLSSIKAKHRPLVYDKRSFSTDLSTILGGWIFHNSFHRCCCQKRKSPENFCIRKKSPRSLLMKVQLFHALELSTRTIGRRRSTRVPLFYENRSDFS